MDKETEKLLISALELISITANQAWWGTRSHCGSDFNTWTCEPCFAYEQCKRNQDLMAIFSELTPAVG